MAVVIGSKLSNKDTWPLLCAHIEGLSSLVKFDHLQRR
jgi:hypothetical protein